MAVIEDVCPKYLELLINKQEDSLTLSELVNW